MNNTSNSSAVSGSLPWAVAQADSDTSGVAITIDFAEGAGEIFATPQTIVLASPLNISNTTSGESITIEGPAAALSVGFGSGMSFSVFKVAANTTAAIDNLAIKNGIGTNGAGIYNDGGTLTVTNCTITQNTSGWSGGGIYSSAGVLTLSNCVISGNRSYNGGAGIYSSGSLLTVTNCTFSDNVNRTGTANGGGIYCTSGTVSNCTFTGNSAGNGGGIYILTGTIDNCTFTGNSSGEGHGDGAGIYSYGATLTVTNSTISGNAGGGIAGAGTVSHCTINNNTGARIGGGIHGAKTVNYCTISGNSVSDWGGGIAAASTVTYCTITNNKAGEYGGGVNGAGTVSHCTISGNQVYIDPHCSGGGIYLRDGGTVSDCTISNNSALGAYGVGGGGICSIGPLTVSNCTIAGNRGQERFGSGGAGGIYSGSTLIVSNSTIAGNIADGNGGGIYVFGVGTLKNCTLSGNTASYSGGGIYGGATLSNTIVANSTAGGDLYASGGAFTGSYDLIGDGSYLSSFTNSLQGNPQLAPLGDNGGPTPTMALLPGSPAINAGDPSYVTSATDYDQRGPGYPRVSKGRIDIGAFELQDVGTTTTVSTSNAAPVYGTSVTLTATIAPALGTTAPTQGSVAFFINGGASLGGGTYVGTDASNDAIFTYLTDATQLLVAGGAAQPVTATYTPGSGFTGSSSTNSVTETVTPAPLTVTAANESKAYGDPIPTLDGSLTGVVSGDNITASFTTIATQTSDVIAGGYLITATLNDPGGRLGNYAVTKHSGTLTITKANQVITWANPAGIVYGTPLSSTQLNATVAVIGPAPAGSLVYSPPAGAVLPVGAQTLTVTAQATQNYNVATKSVTIQVVQQYTFGGFLPPLNKQTFNAGQTIAIGFTVFDASGQPVTSPAAVQSLQVQALDSKGNPVGAPFNPVSTNKKGLVLDEESGDFKFNWSTKGTSAGSYQILVTLADGSSHSVTVKLR